MAESDNQWVFVVGELESRFDEKGYKIPRKVKGEESFRIAIESLCKKHKEPRPQRLLSGLCSSYTTIIDFAEVIARAQGLPPDAISGLIWAASIVVIQVSMFLPPYRIPSTDVTTVWVFSWNKSQWRCETGGPIQ